MDHIARRPSTEETVVDTPRIGLMMIVKNEAAVIERCLASVRGFIDWWVIADTGSTDGTQTLVRRALRGVPGGLVERDWVDFGTNRQEVLELARASPHRARNDYALWIDADGQLTDVPGVRPQLSLDGYFLSTRNERVSYATLSLIRLASAWTWEAPVHEYLQLADAKLGGLEAPFIRAERRGARSQDPEIYSKDAAIIERFLALHPADPRMQFYLGQSYRDAGQPELALTAYRARLSNPAGWAQERWCSAYQIGRLGECVGHELEVVLEAYRLAHQLCPWRAESLIALARLERSRKRYAMGLQMARAAAVLPAPGHRALFVDDEAYTWRAWDEIAINAYWCGEFEEAVDAARRAYSQRPDIARLAANVEWCEAAANARQAP